jgi:hypothetical protein
MRWTGYVIRMREEYRQDFGRRNLKEGNHKVNLDADG